MHRGPTLIAAAVALTLARPAPAATPTVAECLSASERGQVDRDEGRYVRAREAFVTCASSACPPVVRGDCVRWLNEADAGVPTLVFVARDARGVDLGNVVVRIDGAVLTTRLDGRPIAVDPGEHVFTFEAGAMRVDARAIVHVGERNRVVSVRFGGAVDEGDGMMGDGSGERTRAHEPVPLPTAVFGGAAVLSLGTAMVLWISGRSDLSSLESSSCASTRTCSESEVQSVRTRLIVGDVLAGVGTVALGAALWVWFTRDRSAAVSVHGSALRATLFF